MSARVDPQLRALAHPVRLRMLSLLWGAAMSAADLARELDISHALASQHLRRLDETGYVELVDVREKRGGRERRYRARRGTPLTDKASAESEALPLLVETMMATLRERVPVHLVGSPVVTADAELWVLPDSWQAAQRAVLDAMSALHDAALPPHSPGAQRVAVSAVLFALGSDVPVEGMTGGGYVSGD